MNHFGQIMSMKRLKLK